MSLEREVAAIYRRLNDLKRQQAAIHLRCFTYQEGEPYPPEATDEDLIIKIERERELLQKAPNGANVTR